VGSIGVVGISLAEVCPPGPNLSDTDGDGLKDYACVGDWDQSGQCEMVQDLQAALDALDDDDGRLVELSDCSFLPPVAAPGLNGIVEIPSYTTLQGQGIQTRLNGFVETDVTSTEGVLSNADFTNGNVGIVIRDLWIDGGWRGGDTPPPNHHHRMGVFFDGCDDCTVERVTVTDTLHTCLYARNGTNVQFRDSTLDRCGNYTGLGDTFPCAYLYAHSGRQMLNSTIENLECSRSGNMGITTRRESATGIVSGIVFRGNTIRATRIVNGTSRLCILIRGVEQSSYIDNTCIDTGGVATQTAAAYYSEGDVAAVAQITIDGLNVIDTPNGNGLHIQNWVEDFTGRNIHISNTARHCLQITNPQRNFLLEDSQFIDCGIRGIHEFNSVGSGAMADEGLTLRRVSIQNAEAEGIHFNAPVRRLTLEDVTVDGAGASGMGFPAGIRNSTIVDSEIYATGQHGVYIAEDAAGIVFDNVEIHGTGLDGIFLDGTRAQGVDLRVLGSRFSQNRRGIHVDGQPQAEAIVLQGNQIDGTDLEAVRLNLSGDTASALVDCSSNEIMGFGGAMAGGQGRGIVLSGAVALPTVGWNSLVDTTGLSQYGIDYAVPGSPTAHLCSNSCGGFLEVTDCVHVSTDPTFEIDGDGDQIVDACDGCPAIFDPDQIDGDGDGTTDACDNCPGEANPDQSDNEGDGLGDACDPDDDNDGVSDDSDNCALAFNPLQGNGDGDPLGNECDCAMQDPTAWSQPSIVELALAHRLSTDETVLSWSPSADSGGSAPVVYDVLRSTDAGDFTTLGFCLESDEPDLEAIDFGEPPPGGWFHYLVRPENGCPPPGPMGQDTSGTQRGGRDCP